MSINQDLPLLTRAWLQSPYYTDLSDRQKVIFGFICDEPGPHRQRDLVRRLGIEKSVVSRGINKMVEGGLLVRVPNPLDHRDCTVRATVRGAEVRQIMATLQVPA